MKISTLMESEQTAAYPDRVEALLGRLQPGFKLKVGRVVIAGLPVDVDDQEGDVVLYPVDLAAARDLLDKLRAEVRADDGLKVRFSKSDKSVFLQAA